MKRNKRYLIKEKTDREDKKIEAVAFSMWLDGPHKPTHQEVGWLTYWEYYEIYLSHEKRDSYRRHVISSLQLFKKLKK